MQLAGGMHCGKAFAGTQVTLNRQTQALSAARWQAIVGSTPFRVQAAAPATQRLRPGTKRISRKPKSSKQPRTGTKRLDRGGGGNGGGGTFRFGTQAKKKITSIANLSKEAAFRQRADGVTVPKLLSRLEQLRLLSKLEDLKILSLLQRNGITLTFIEESGLLETAEKLNLLSAAADRKTPGLLFAAALALYALAPAAVFLIPDNGNWLIGAQVAVVLIGALGGTAAFAGGSLLSTLQKDVK